jgi:hypothetical protein
MPEILLGVVILVLGLWAVNAFSKADPKQAARLVRALGGVAVLIFAVFLLLRGEIGLAVPIGLIGLGLLGWVSMQPRDLFAAYFDRRAPGWREYTQGDAGASAGQRTPSGGKMTEEEAYQILGIQPGASADEITRAHRTLIKKLHPDQGGTTYLAARVNEAKDVLLRRHR